MKLNYEQEANGMYKLRKPDFDDIALELLREHLATAIDSPCEIDINYLIRDCLYLDVYSKHLSPDKSVLGLVAFDDTTIPCYDLHFNPTTFDVFAVRHRFLPWLGSGCTAQPVFFRVPTRCRSGHRKVCRR